MVECQKARKEVDPVVRHVILWTLKSGLGDDEKKEIKKKAKEALEGLMGVVPSLRAVTVHTDPLPSSNCDMMLETVFDDEEGLKAYASHPAHVSAANAFVRPFTAERRCMDFVG